MRTRAISAAIAFLAAFPCVVVAAQPAGVQSAAAPAIDTALDVYADAVFALGTVRQEPPPQP